MKRPNSIKHEFSLLILGVFSSFLPACEPENEPPTAKLEVNPLTAEVPAEVRMRVTGEDPDGVGDIKQYNLMIGSENIKSNTPIDITRTFTDVGTIKIYGQVTDSENQINKTSAKSLELLVGPYIDQSASLVNENEIIYSATVHKKTNAKLEIKKDGALFMTIPIPDVNTSGVDFQKVFKYNPDGITKGNYEFKLKSDDLEKTNSVQIQNYKPTTDLSGVDAELMEGVEKTVTLPTPLDKNPEDNPVTIKSAKSLDNKTQVTLSGYNVTIKPLTYTGDYQIEIEFGSTVGGLEKAILAGSITQEPWTYYVNPFVSTNPNGAAYDALTTKAQRDAYVQEKLFDDWTNTIPGIIHIWDCTQYSEQVHINFHGLPATIGYLGFDLDSLYYYGGTDKDNGKYGIPVYSVDIDGSEIEHNMDGIVTGQINNGDITKFENWNLIEPSNDRINQKPGLSYIPENCTIEIRAPLRDRQDAYYDLYLPILRFEIKNGVQTSYWINQSTNIKIIEVSQVRKS